MVVPGEQQMQIRLAATSDSEAIARIYAPIVESTPISFEIEPPDAREIARRIDATLPSLPWLICEDQARLRGSNQVAGYAYASPHKTRTAYQWSIDVSVYIDSDFRGMGFGKALYTSLFEILAAQGYFNAFAGITLPNPASVGLHESMGFQPIGVYRSVGYKLGQWRDVGWWQRNLRLRVDAPKPVLSLNQLQTTAAWKHMLRN
jgi:phosphinothricin acetyltransferase